MTAKLVAVGSPFVRLQGLPGPATVDSGGAAGLPVGSTLGGSDQQFGVAVAVLVGKDQHSGAEAIALRVADERPVAVGVRRIAGPGGECAGQDDQDNCREESHDGLASVLFVPRWGCGDLRSS